MHERTGDRRDWRHRVGRRTFVLVIGASLLMSGAAWVAGTTLVVSQPIADPDAIVSLASHEWERLPQTASLAKEHPGALVILTLPTAVSIHNCHDCGRRVDRLIEQGVQGDRIRVLPLSGEGTHGEAEACRDYATRAGIRRLIIVTSPYHTRRAFATFRKVFSATDVTLGIVPAPSRPPARPLYWWSAPYDRAYVPYEWAAIIYYAIHHGVPPGAP